MRRSGPLLAAAVVVLTNVIVLVGVARNRSAEPDAVVTLTEREAPLGWTAEENTGRSLQLQVGGWRYLLHEPDSFFDQRKLESIGFDCSVAPEDPRAEIFYDKALPRRTYAVLEQNGRAWEELTERARAHLEDLTARVARGEEREEMLEFAKKNFEEQERSASRLFAIDVGNDPEALRREHPDRGRIVVVPAEARLDHSLITIPETKQQAWRLQGRIVILTDAIHLPLPLHEVFESLPGIAHQGLLMSDGRYDDEPRYEVVLAVGRRYEPWVKDVRRLREAGIAPVSGQRPGPAARSSGKPTTAPGPGN